MAKRWKHWVRVVEGLDPDDVEGVANSIIDGEDFDAVVPRLTTTVVERDGEDYAHTTILLCFRKQVEVAE